MCSYQHSQASEDALFLLDRSSFRLQEPEFSFPAWCSERHQRQTLPHWENIFSFASSLPLRPGLASPVRCCYSACQRTEEAPAMNELMNEQSLSVGRRLPGSLGEADIHFLGVGWNASRCFPAVSPGSTSTGSLPLLLPHFSFRSHCSWPPFSSYAAYIREVTLIYPHLYYLHAVPFSFSLL